MGQQQLLLLVLGIVIVGLAVVVGIQAFSENQEKSNQDARINDGVRIASDLQAWALKPAAFGGNDGTLAAADFADNLGYDENGDGNYENPNGVYALGAITNGAMVTSTNPNGDNVYVMICGFDSDDISTQIAGTAPTTC